MSRVDWSNVVDGNKLYTQFKILSHILRSLVSLEMVEAVKCLEITTDLRQAKWQTFPHKDLPTTQMIETVILFY